MQRRALFVLLLRRLWRRRLQYQAYCARGSSVVSAPRPRKRPLFPAAHGLRRGNQDGRTTSEAAPPEEPPPAQPNVLRRARVRRSLNCRSDRHPNRHHLRFRRNSLQDLAAAQGNTRSNIKTAEDNLQLASGKQPVQCCPKRLVEKISGFLSQATKRLLPATGSRAESGGESGRPFNELVNR